MNLLWIYNRKKSFLVYHNYKIQILFYWKFIIIQAIPQILFTFSSRYRMEYQCSSKLNQIFGKLLSHLS
ncbi:unnamed protein product [Paramecium pentaurelia]|uniref:Uncharacterized protein n=1 Tax=Paramecium pentaurelia TaxID=43138 RepID=A0A8S1YM81_9CILI|nr:unnamed protein product [Paramecium pentaurelia]